MELKNKKVLVTGACGFIGSHLVERLIEEGCNVRAFVYYNSFNSRGWIDTFNKEKIEKIEIFAGDIRDPYGVRTAVRDVDVVFHLAALIGIPFSYHSPDSYIDTNIKGTLNVLQACRDYKTERVIITSTSEVYGTAKYVPIDEKHPLQGQSPYSATKIGADQLALSFYSSFQTPVSIIRPFNTYGPRQSARAVIPTVILQMASGKGRVKLGNIHTTRDFNYVADVVSGFIAAAESERSTGEIINVGSNYEISIGDTVELIAEIMDTKVEILSENKRVRPEKSEVERLLADNNKARELLGWSPLYGGLDGFRRGLAETIQWFLKPENVRGYKVDIYNI